MYRLRYPPPRNEYDFELLCLRLLRQHWRRPQLQQFGRRGDEQYGIDIFDPSPSTPVMVAQCKLHNDKPLTAKEVRAEVNKARGFPGSIDAYLLLTTSKLTTSVQNAVKDLNNSQKTSKGFSIELLGWEQIEDLLDHYPNVREGFYGLVGRAHVVSRLRSIFVIGGTSNDDNKADSFVLQTRGMELGEVIAASGADLFICSPFEDSLDMYVAYGYAKANAGGVIHFVSPKHESVTQQFEYLNHILPKSTAQIDAWWQPKWEEPESRSQAYLLCQLEALLKSDAIICIGGRVDRSATTLIHFAEARKKVVVPYSFLGGAARRALDRNSFRLPADVVNALADADEVKNAIVIANRLTVEQVTQRRRDNQLSELFISHASVDREYALVIREVAESLNCKVVFGDDEITSNSGVEFAIESAIRRADVFVTLWSQNYACSPWCFDELMVAQSQRLFNQTEIWVLNIDGTPIVPTWLRELPVPIVAKSTNVLRATVADLLQQRA